MNIKLHINIDHVATLRQARGTTYPDPLWAASLCELAGADGITVHLREDRRHIQDRDVRILRQTVRTVLNLEMAATAAMVEIALEIKPDIVTLVPEKREERTTEGGLSVLGPQEPLARAIGRLEGASIPVSLFVDPEVEVVEAVKRLGARRLELHTGDYCEAKGEAERGRELERLRKAAARARALSLHVAAGHGLDYPNVGEVAAISEITELNIGHAVVSRAVFVGMSAAVSEMAAVMRRARQAHRVAGPART